MRPELVRGSLSEALVADETREGDVYRKLLDKLEEARKALGGHVFDVLGKLQFAGAPYANCSSRPSGTATRPMYAPA